MAKDEKNSGGQEEHLQGVGDKEQRMYEHIKESYVERGRSEEKAEELAARTVMKHHGEEDHKTGE